MLLSYINETSSILIFFLLVSSSFFSSILFHLLYSQSSLQWSLLFFLRFFFSIQLTNQHPGFYHFFRYCLQHFFTVIPIPFHCFLSTFFPVHAQFKWRWEDYVTPISKTWKTTLLRKSVFNKYFNFIPGQNTEKHNRNSDRIPLVINWWRHFAGISKILHERYEHIAQNIRVLKRFFPTRLYFLQNK